MSDIWDNNGNEQPAAPTEPAASAEPTAPAAPAESTDSTETVSRVAPDGSYRYVPPRAPQPPQPPRQEPSPVPPQPPKKSGNGWMTVLGIMCAFAVLLFGVWGAFMWTKTADLDGLTQTDVDNGGNADQGGNGGNGSGAHGNTDKNNGGDMSDPPPVNENAPQLGIQGSGDNLKGDAPSLEVGSGEQFYYSDGGLTTEEIVKRNYDSTVVLTTYSETNGFGWGESSLVESSASSGIVWTADGYIITNRHCVVDEDTGKKYDRIDVTTYDGTVYQDAQVIGADEATDLAVIKVNATNLVPAEFGNSDELAVGTRVIALGNAAGLSWTATQGILSAKARDVYEDTGYAIKCLQVDVAINSGNSGGPLLNKYGQVVGINSAKIAASGYEGLGFSIPINEARVVIESLAKYGYVKGRVALGITGKTFDDGNYQGFIIMTIEKGSCLEGTAAKVGDLIVAVDGVTVADYGALRAELAKHQVGDAVTLKLFRSNDRTGEVTTHEVTVTLKEQGAG